MGEQFHSLDDIEKKKQSWMEKAAGAKPPEDKLCGNRTE